MHYRSLTYSARELADQSGCSLLGDGSIQINDLCSIDYPKRGSLSFIKSDSREVVSKLLSTLQAPAGAIVPSKVAPAEAPHGIALLLAENSFAAFVGLVPLFYEEVAHAKGVHPTAIIDPSAKIDPAASIGAYCVIGARSSIGKNVSLLPHVRVYQDVTIQDSVTIYSGASIRSNTSIGARSIIHDNAVIGADGFGYIPDPKCGLRKVPQLGYVEIGTDVEIGANTCIDRGAFGPTKIGNGVKIDNLAQVGHNVIIGDHSVLCGQVAIGGSTKIGQGVVIGGASGVADHLEIVSGVRLGGKAGVTTSLLEPGDYLGFPAVKASEWRRLQVQLRRLRAGSRKGKS